jgi:hypothetical protein
MILEEQIHKNIYRSYYRGQTKDLFSIFEIKRTVSPKKVELV